MERAKMLALADYEADLCDCPVCAGLAKAARIQTDADATLVRQVYGNRGPQPGDELPSDGRRIIGLEAPPEDAD